MCKHTNMVSGFVSEACARERVLFLRWGFCIRFQTPALEREFQNQKAVKQQLKRQTLVPTTVTVELDQSPLLRAALGTLSVSSAGSPK